jgi:hypothetical protein
MLQTGEDYSYGYCQDELKRIKDVQIKNVLKKINQFGIEIEDLKFAL